MIIEQRRYVAARGATTADFFALQLERGFTVVQPIMERLIGYFEGADGAASDVLHLWRYDSFADWTTRLHGLYAKPELVDYFVKARSLLVSQENKFLAPAPTPSLSPYWNALADWLPGREPPPFVFNDAFRVEQTIAHMAPGGLDRFWQRAEREPQEDPYRPLIGIFATVIGRMHEVTVLRAHPRGADGDRKGNAMAASDWERRVADEAGAIEVATRWFRPSSIPALSPLFQFAA